MQTNTNLEIEARTKNGEVSTWLLIGGVYATWLLLMSAYEQLPSILWLVLMSFTLALFGSLCHELLHGHPSKNQKLNDAMAKPPLSLYPYFDYKRTHLKHHNEADLTKPGIDPESFFIHPDVWLDMPSWKKKLAWANMTLAGRLLLGPGRTYIGLFRECFKEYQTDDAWAKRHWLYYGLSVILVLIIVSITFKVPIWIYVLAVYIGHAIISLRSFYEHRTNVESQQRTVIIPTNKVLGFVYLYNNLHVVHHSHPGLAWYLIPAEYQRHKERYHQSNDGFEFQGYLPFLKYLVLPVVSPIFPENN